MRRKGIFKGILAMLAAGILLQSAAGPSGQGAYDGGQADSGETEHSTTVLVYLCGGDLESRFGAATGDIREMAASGFDTSAVKLVIMAGGTRSRNFGTDAGQAVIIEIGEHGMRRLWASEGPTNMADGETLKAFLDYGYAHFPAERCALILWGHGGGPHEGLGPDELYGDDTLTPEEIRAALAGSFPAGEKLCWIGFDACMMATLETAWTVADYAEYLIASQGRESSDGWNYAFLKGLERDADGEETARRIIGMSLEENEETDELRSLSCIRLDRITKVRIAMDQYFRALVPLMTEESFPEFLQARKAAADVGDAKDGDEPDTGADYDTVDLKRLTEMLRHVPGCSERLLAAVGEATVCCRSNRGTMCGLSICHPCHEDESRSGERDDYCTRFGDLSPAYMRYLQRFGELFAGQAR